MTGIIWRMIVSVLIPVFNEEKTIEEIIRRVRAVNIADEICVIDDGSTDATPHVLEKLQQQGLVCFFRHDRNLGKGAAIRTGIQKVRGETVIIQDADLEYDPRDYKTLLQPISEGLADVVYGSRFLGGARRPVMFWHMVANKFLTLLTNILYDTILTDMETGYKVFRREVVQKLKLRANRFDFEPEFTAKVLKRKVRLFEVPITFNPRDYADGKKIGLKDAFQAVWTLIKYRFID